MNSPYSQAQLATGVVRRGISRLAAKYPFHARVLEQFQLAVAPEVGTMGVQVVPGGIRLLFAPAFVLSISTAELGGVLVHEVHHVVLGHVVADRKEFPDTWALRAAEELTVNEFVVEPLPGKPVLLEQFPGLPPMESTKERYDRLAGTENRQSIRTIGPESDAEASGSAEDAGQDAGHDSNDAPDNGVNLVDNHDVWDQEESRSPDALSVVAATLQQAIIEAGCVPSELRQALSAQGIGLISVGAGETPGDETHLVDGQRQGTLRWQQILRRYTGNVLDPHPVYHWPSRRCPNLIGIVPGRRRHAGRPVIMSVIDTSSSMSDDMLEQIDGELRKLAQGHVVHVVECDCRIQRVSRYGHRLRVVTGRGGTDFRPPLEREFLRRINPDVIIVFTDGDGPAPDLPPTCPLIWCLVPGGQAPADWGRVLRMDQ